jgi:hypothetical protein
VKYGRWCNEVHPWMKKSGNGTCSQATGTGISITNADSFHRDDPGIEFQIYVKKSRGRRSSCDHKNGGFSTPRLSSEFELIVGQDDFL